MGYEGPNPPKEILTFQKRFFQDLRDHYPQAFKADHRAHDVEVSALSPNQTACSLHHERVSSAANIERVAWLANVNTTSSSVHSSDTVEKHEFDVYTMSGNCSRELTSLFLCHKHISTHSRPFTHTRSSGLRVQLQLGGLWLTGQGIRIALYTHWIFWLVRGCKVVLNDREK